MKPYYCENCAFFDELKNEQPCCYCVEGINFVELEEEESRANHAKWQRENKDKINAYQRERRKLAKMKGGAE